MRWNRFGVLLGGVMMGVLVPCQSDAAWWKNLPINYNKKKQTKIIKQVDKNKTKTFSLGLQKIDAHNVGTIEGSVDNLGTSRAFAVNELNSIITKLRKGGYDVDALTVGTLKKLALPAMETFFEKVEKNGWDATKKEAQLAIFRQRVLHMVMFLERQLPEMDKADPGFATSARDFRVGAQHTLMNQLGYHEASKKEQKRIEEAARLTSERVSFERIWLEWRDGKISSQEAKTRLETAVEVARQLLADPV